MEKLSVEIIDETEVRFFHPDNQNEVENKSHKIVHPEFYNYPRYKGKERKTKAFSQAIAEMENLLNKYPDHLSIYYYLDLIYQAIGEVDTAINIWECSYELITSLLPKRWLKDYVMYDIVSSNYSVFAIASCLNAAYLQKADNTTTKVIKKHFLIKAEKVGLEMLKWCKNDRCGVKERVVDAQLKLGNYHSVLKVCSKYLGETEAKINAGKDDTSPGICYGRVLAAVNLQMDTIASEWVKLAIRSRPLIAKILLTDKPLPTELTYNTTRRGYNEAYNFWFEIAEEWWKSPEAMELLRSHEYLADKAIENHKRRWESAEHEGMRSAFPEIYCWPN